MAELIDALDGNFEGYDEQQNLGIRFHGYVGTHEIGILAEPLRQRAPVSSPRAAIMTRAPSATNISTVAAPIPLLPPVTMATLPASLPSFFPL